MILPDEFVKQTRELMGEERFARYLAAFDEEPPVSIRLNPLHLSSQDDSSLFTLHSSLWQVPWCPLGVYLDHRPNFTFDPLLHAGCYYVQEAASMFLHHVLSEELKVKSEEFPSGVPSADGMAAANSSLFTLHSSLKVLDLCAAPGGKSTCALSALPAGTRLWANEPVRQRASVLSENIQKWGYEGCVVTNAYPRDYVRSGLTFDIIICDVPCSGEGMFRKDPQTIGEWSPQQVEKCWRLQRDIVSDAWQCLNPGGLLIYSTCTFNTKENEENVRWILNEYDAEAVAVSTLAEWGITGSLLPGFDAPVYRFIPGITRSEGLFVCVLRKGGVEGEMKGDGRSVTSLHPSPSTRHQSSLCILFDSDAPRQQAVATVELSYADAISYLRGEALQLPADTPRGLIAVTFQDHPLGLVKNIGTRANNLYPKEWRIRSTHIPQEYEAILRHT